MAYVSLYLDKLTPDSTRRPRHCWLSERVAVRVRPGGPPLGRASTRVVWPNGSEEAAAGRRGGAPVPACDTPLQPPGARARPSHHGERRHQPRAHAVGGPGDGLREDAGGGRHRGAGPLLPLRPGRGDMGKLPGGGGGGRGRAGSRGPSAGRHRLGDAPRRGARRPVWPARALTEPLRSLRPLHGFESRGPGLDGPVRSPPCH